jgi:hypothetical protein
MYYKIELKPKFIYDRMKLAKVIFKKNTQIPKALLSCDLSFKGPFFFL